MEKDTKFLYNDIKNVRYSYIYQRYPVKACEGCGDKVIFQKPIESLLKIENQIATVKEKFILCFKRTKMWVQDFEYEYIYGDCVKYWHQNIYSYIQSSINMGSY